MEKYNLKYDLKRISFFIGTIFTILLLFTLFTLIVILPIFLTSKYYPGIYSLTASALILGLLLIFLIRKLTGIWKKYKNFRLFILHIMFSPFILFFSLLLLGLEFVFFRCIESLLSKVFTENIFLISILNFEKIIYIITICLNIFNVFLFSIVLIIILNTFFIKLFFELLSFPVAATLLILINLIFAASLFFLRRLFFIVKSYLKSKSISQISQKK